MNYFKKKNLTEVINFGKMPMANDFVRDKDKKIFTYELKLGFNKKFKLAQIYEFPKPSNMFNENYAFITSTSKYMANHFKKLSIKIKKKLKKYLFLK